MIKRRSLILACTLAAACSTGGGGGDEDGGLGSCTGVMKVQGAQQPCCTAYGVDACAPHLFCAAIEGRTVATCNPENSVADGMPCTSDVQCASKGCNAMLGKCEYSLGTACDTTLGCATPAGTTVLCAGSESSAGTDSYVDPNHLICDSTSGLPFGTQCGLCNTTADCTNAGATCTANRCLGTRCHLRP